MKIELKCSCGARASFDDPKDNFPTSVKELSREWQEKHKGCLTPAKPTVPESK